MSSRDKKITLGSRDQEDLESFAEQLRDLSIHGCGMEPASTGGEPPTTPKWLDSLSNASNSALARSIHRRLGLASRIYAPAATVLLALHDPAAVLCDGKTSLSEEECARAKEDPTFRVREKLDVGRRLAVYPCTWTADEARRWVATQRERRSCDGMGRGLAVLDGAKGKPGRRTQEPLEAIAEHMTLSGVRAVDRLSRMVDAKRRSRGALAIAWGALDAEAVLMIEQSIRAWNEQPTHRATRVRRKTDRLDRLPGAA